MNYQLQQKTVSDKYEVQYILIVFYLFLHLECILLIQNIHVVILFILLKWASTGIEPGLYTPEA